MAWRALLGYLLASQLSGTCPGASWQVDGFHVYSGESIQEGLDQAAQNPTNKTVKVHAGIYRPDSTRQALIWFNRSHDGVRLEAIGDVTLTAANPELVDRKSPAYPAMVNHVVYFGDGISARTVLKGFRITGANHFVTKEPPEVEVNSSLPRGLFFYADGGAVKIFGRSYPTLQNLEIADNYASPCGGGISVEHVGGGGAGSQRATLLENCIFRNNRSQITGAAVDLLPGSFAIISNCLFVANVANMGANYISDNKVNPEFTNSAPLTVFPQSRAVVRNCTFVGNRNAVDDLGEQSIYQDCIFWRNTLGNAFYGGVRYELDIENRAHVTGCYFGGAVLDPNRGISKSENVFDAPDPAFDEHFRPRSGLYRTVGFRPFSE
jgi:hypothetical protein